VHSGSQGWCTGLKVVPACVVSFIHKTHHKKTSRRKREHEFFHDYACIGSIAITYCCSVWPFVVSRHAWVDLVSVFINERLRSDSSVPAAHRSKLVGQ